MTRALAVLGSSGGRGHGGQPQSPAECATQANACAWRDGEQSPDARTAPPIMLVSAPARSGEGDR